MYHSLIGGDIMPINWKRKILSTFCVMLMVFMIFQTAAAEIETYTIDDDGSSITIVTGQRFNVSLQMVYIGEWQLVGYDLLGESGYDSSVLEIIEGRIWTFPENPGTNDVIFNLTFEGIKAGNDIITYNYHNWNNSIYDTFTLNVTVIESDQSTNILSIIIAVVIIGVIPGIILFKWMKRGEKHEK